MTHIANLDNAHPAVDTHPFWAELVGTFRPDYEAAQGGTVRFNLALASTKDVCIPCMYYTPPEPHAAYTRMPTAKLGRFPVCRLHYGMLCSHCLRTSMPNDMGSDTLVLRRPVMGDVDEAGNHRNHDGLTCSHCREKAFNATLGRDLLACSRGGPLLGLNNRWNHSTAYKEHVYFGIGRSDMMARQAIEDWFLMQHTRISSFAEDISQLQHMLRRYKTIFYERRMLSVPPVEVAHLRRLVWTLFEDDDPAFEIGRLYRRWTHEMETGMYDEADYRLDVERLRSIFGNSSLWPFIRDKLVLRIINLWISDRFLSGYWVMPSDEIEQMLDSTATIHTPLHVIAHQAIRPTDHKYLPTEQWRSGNGLFRYNMMLGHMGDYYLPPDRLLQILNMRFSEVMTTRLEIAFAEIIPLYSRGPYKDYERVEAHLAANKTKEILLQLEQPFAWRETEDAGDGWRINPTSPASDPGGGSVISDEEEGSVDEFENAHDALDEDEGVDDDEPKEPRVEVVPTNDHLPEYDIRDGWSTASDGERDEFDVGEEHEKTSEPSAIESATESIALSPSLGKRKASDEEMIDEHRPLRTRLGSGQTSYSGDSTNTALVTPDDSPSLLAEENIKLAEEDATDTTPVAPLAIGEIAASPAASPTLGKRKSPEDDDLTQPPRRPVSLPVSLAPTSEASDDDMGQVREDKASSGAASTINDEEVMSNTAPCEQSDAPVLQAVAAKVVRSNRVYGSDYSAASDSESEGSFDTDQIADTPFVPPSFALLGPGVDELLESTWYRSLEPLRRCHCAICQRAEKVQSENLHRILLSSIDDLVSPSLHIA